MQRNNVFMTLFSELSTIDLDLYMSGTVLQTQHYVYYDLMIAQ